MSRISIKLRATLWFTLIMVLLVAAMLAFLLTVGENMVISSSRDTLTDVVHGGLSEIEYDDGRLEIDDDLDYFRRGVYLSVYDSSGRLLYGRLPNDFDVSLGFEDAEQRTVSNEQERWYVYDLLHSPSGGEPVWIRGLMSVTAEESIFSAIIRLAFIALPTLVLLAAVIGYALINRAFKPVRAITEAADKIADGKDLTRRIELGDGRDEIYTMAATFDRMLDRLQTAFEREKQFTSDASHELRTPTAVIIAQCEYAIENAKTLDEAKQALGTVLQQAGRMSVLISQLLTLSRAENSKEAIEAELINMSELCEMVAEQAKEAASENSIRVETDIEPNILMRGDETMLMRLLLNLTDNAVKYGREGGKMTLRLKKRGNIIEGAVEDDGIGIAPEHLGKIWERFYQVDTARSSTKDGVGIGLPMVRYIAEAHGGSVRAESELGKGSKFVFTLPQS